MSTNIISASAAPVGGNAWQSAGQGIQGLAAMLSSYLQNRQQQPKTVNAPAQIPGAATATPASLGLGEAQTAQYPIYPSAQPIAQSAGVGGLLQSRFPGIFSGASTYGGL